MSRQASRASLKLSLLVLSNLSTMSWAIDERKLSETASALVAAHIPPPKNVLNAGPLKCATYIHKKGSVCLREEQETNTTTFAVSSLPTTSKGFEAFSFLIKDCATGAASFNPVTYTANLSDLSCGLADTASTRNANNTNTVDLLMSSFTFRSLLTCELLWLCAFSGLQFGGQLRVR